MIESTVNIRQQKVDPLLICWIKIYALNFDQKSSQKCSKICNKKFHKGNENGLTSLLQYVITPKSTNSEIIIPIIVTKSLKFELVPFFMNQTLGCKNIAEGPSDENRSDFYDNEDDEDDKK